MFSAAESVETSWSSCGITAIPLSIASRGVARRWIAPSSADLALVGIGGDLAGQDVDQRRLARAVLADERMDLAGDDVEVHAVERADAGEGHRDAAGLEERGHGAPLTPALSRRMRGFAARMRPEAPLSPRRGERAG